MRPTFSSRALTVLALSLALIAFPLGVLASHQYSDVPTSNPFHGDIAAITNAGVTSGCGGTEYCPDRAVTRAEMAAFMNRLGALAPNKTPVVNADKVDGFDGTDLALGLAVIPSGTTVTGTQFVHRTIVVDNELVGFQIELPGRAPVALTSGNVNFEGPSAFTSDGDAACLGNYLAPSAPAGKLCLYFGAFYNIDNANGQRSDYFADRYVRVFFQSAGNAGNYNYLYVVWAYTAP